MHSTIFHVDAFTDTKPFSGNPAKVCVLYEPKTASWMQQVANEMNLSETAFLLKLEDGFSLRWFTPITEVSLCGHATLASAHILWEERILQENMTIRFYTQSGLLTACKKESGIELDFPAEPATSIKPPDNLLHAINVNPKFIGENRFDYLIEVESEVELRSIIPNIALLSTLKKTGIIVTSISESLEFDFVSRYFAPAEGIEEDPVTGSAHCCLAPYWASRLNKTKMIAYQASARGGLVKMQLEDTRVYLGGNAVTIARGELLV